MTYGDIFGVGVDTFELAENCLQELSDSQTFQRWRRIFTVPHLIGFLNTLWS